MTTAILTQEELKRVVSYDKETGSFTWLVKQGARALKGNLVPRNSKDGDYLYVKIFGKGYAQHRLAWLYVFGTFPEDQLDHINKIKTDNRIANLRQANNSQNQHNMGMRVTNTSGFRGVSFKARNKKYQAAICINGKTTYLGIFKRAEDAFLVYKQTAEAYCPNFFKGNL